VNDPDVTMIFAFSITAPSWSITVPLMLPDAGAMDGVLEGWGSIAWEVGGEEFSGDCANKGAE
jgi:hypothetical protein